MTVPTVSIVMGAYNAQRYLAEALDSLLAQTFGDFELVVVDDGSTDYTPVILQGYQHKDPRVRIERIEHAGIVAAANKGLEMARAPLIARADADDIQRPDRLQKQVQFLQEHPEVVAVGSRMLSIEPYGSPLRESEHKLTHEEIDAELLAGSGWALPQPAATMRKGVALAVGGYRDKYPWSEDLDLFLRMAEAGKLANLPEVLVKYRFHANSTNHKRYAIQLANKPPLLREAYERRGLTPPADLHFEAPWDGDLADRYTSWAWAALKDHNIYGARRNAWAAVKKSPLSMTTWRALACALRGS